MHMSFWFLVVNPYINFKSSTILNLPQTFSKHPFQFLLTFHSVCTFLNDEQFLILQQSHFNILHTKNFCVLTCIMFPCRTSFSSLFTLVLYPCLWTYCLTAAQYVAPRQNVQSGNPPVLSGSYASSASQSEANRQQHAAAIANFGSLNSGQQLSVTGYNTPANNQRPNGQYPAGNQQLSAAAIDQGRIPITGSQSAVVPFHVSHIFN